MKNYLLLLLCAGQLCGFETHKNFEKTHFIVGYTPGHDKDTSNRENEQIEVAKSDKIPSTFTYFTTVDDVSKEILSRISSAKKSIYIATFTLTDSKIADCLIRAHKAGIEVTVITDKERMRDKYSKVDKLVAQKVPVFYYNSDLNQNPKQKKSKNGLMHHKFIIVDEAILIFGSLNLTKAGQNENIENITVTTKAKMVTDYLDEFKRLLLLSTKINL